MIALPSCHAAVVNEFVAAGHRVTLTVNQYGNRKASINGGRQMDMGEALDRMEKILTDTRSWSWMRKEIAS